MQWIKKILAKMFGSKKTDWDTLPYGTPPKEKAEESQLTKLNGGL